MIINLWFICLKMALPLNFKGCGIDITLAFQVFEISAFEI
jgi:hypothetical protein